MDILTRHVKILIIILISVLIITSLGCSDDPSSSKKEDEDPIPQDVLTIGFEGGTVEKGDLTITIPSGAFGENSVSESYKINELPSNYNKRTAIKLKYSHQLNGDSFLALGQMAIDVSKKDFTSHFILQMLQFV